MLEGIEALAALEQLGTISEAAARLRLGPSLRFPPPRGRTEGVAMSA